MAVRRGASVARWFLEWFKSIAIALVVWLFLRTFVVEAFTIPSGSMKNTLLVGDFLFVNKFLYGAEVPFIHKHLPMVREPQRGDILVFDSIEEDMKIVKRLIGIPGDTIAMHNGAVYRNGHALSEPYAINSDPLVGADVVARSRMRDWQVKHFAGPVPPHYNPDLHDWGPGGRTTRLAVRDGRQPRRFLRWPVLGLPAAHQRPRPAAAGVLQL